MESRQFGMQADLIFENQIFSICFPTGKAHADNCSCTQAVSESAGKTSRVEKDVIAAALPDGRCKFCPHLGEPGEAAGFTKTIVVPQRAGSTSPVLPTEQLAVKQNSRKGGSPDLTSQQDDFQMTRIF